MTTDAPIALERYAFEDVLVDARAHRVTKDGQELALEPKAYAVLLELLRAPGAAVTRDALLDAVWGHRHVTPAVLNRIIAMLRRALGDDADHPRLIRTVHGTGYSFIAPLAPFAAQVEPPAPTIAPGDEAAAQVVASDRAIEDPVDVPPERASPVSGRLRAGSILALVVAVVVAVTFMIAYYTRA